jgi:hypothetical protein
MGDTQMRFTLGRRSLAIALVTGIATLGVTSAASAQTTIPAPTPAHHAGFLGGGLFKTIFGIFDAVRAQTPAIAAPVIADAVTAGDITQAQADELTALFSATWAKSSGQRGARLAPAQGKVLAKVMQAVLAKLADIAKPVVDKAVADGDLTQKQADLITKVIGLISSFKPGSFAHPGAGATTVTSPVTAVQKQVTKKVKKAARHRAGKRHKTRRATR